MYYQVVARSCVPDGTWDYYPYWSPVRDKDAAARLAIYAAQTGYEAAILQSVTAEMLQNIAQSVVDRQDARMLPSSRYLPGTRAATAAARREQSVSTEVELLQGERRSPELPDKTLLDARRLHLEQGPGGDVTLDTEWQAQQISFPRRMDVLRVWMRLRRQVLQGQVGSALDGAPECALED